MTARLIAVRCEAHGHRYEAVDHRAPCPTCNGSSPYAATELDTRLAEPDEQPSTNGTAVAQLRARLMTTAQIRRLPPPAPLIDGWLYLDSLAMLYGPSGAGKSHVGIDLAMTVTALPTWHGKQVTAGSALYVVAEGAAGIGMRIDAWEQHHGLNQQRIDDDTGRCELTWHPEAINVYSPQWASALAELVAEERYHLVVIDTFARSIPGADENSAKDIGQAVAHLDMIRRAAGSCVLLIHHAGKDRTAGARGSSALRGAMTTELELDGDGDALTLKNAKQRDAPEAEPLRLRLQPVNGSVVVVQAETVDRGGELPASVLKTHAALVAIDVPGGVSTTTWLKACDLTERTFYRHRSGLLQRGYIINVGTDKQARYRPVNIELGEDCHGSED